MSDMNGNPHYEHIKQWDGKAMNEAEVGLIAAHSTLALAYEQRTANAIAWCVHQARTSQPTYAITEQIEARLGISPLSKGEVQ